MFTFVTVIVNMLYTIFVYGLLTLHEEVFVFI